MTAGFVEVFFGHMRCPDFFEAIALAQAIREGSQLLAKDGTARREHRQTRADHIREDKQIELLAQLAVIAPLGFLEHLQVLIEFILGRESHTVDALHLSILVVTAPVSAADSLQLEGADLAGCLNVRAAAEVHKIAVFIKGGCFDLGVALGNRP